MAATAPGLPPGLALPPVVAGMVPHRFNLLVCDTMVGQAIAEGTHNSIHNMVLAAVQGIFGPVAYPNFRAAWTPTRRATTLVHFASARYDDFDDINQAARGAHFGNPVQVARVAAHNALPRDTELRLICTTGCAVCFRFLVEWCGLPVESFDRGGKSYLWYAVNHGHTKLARYILDRLRPQSLWKPLSIDFTNPVLLQDDILKMLAPFPILIKRWIERAQAALSSIPPIAPPGGSFTNLGNRAHLLAMAPWIDAQTADRLHSLGINISIGFAPRQGTMWNAVLCAVNPHRRGVIEWMDQHPFTPSVTYPAGTMINRGSWAPLSLFTCGEWPPWAVAIRNGDEMAATALSMSPNIDPCVIGRPKRANTLHQPYAPPLVDSVLLGTQRIGQAVSNNINEKGFRMLRRWVYRASNGLTMAKAYKGLWIIIEQIMGRTSRERRRISRRAQPPGMTVSQWNRRKRDLRKEKMDVAIRMVRLIMDESIREIRPNWDLYPGQIVYRTLADTDEFKAWASGVRYRTIQFPDIVALRHQLDKPTGIYARQVRSLPDNYLMDSSA